jgi:hypothetical protein
VNKKKKKKPSRASRELLQIVKAAHKRLDARDATKKRGK